MNDVESVNSWAVSLLEFETTLSNKNVHFQLLLNELSTLVDVSNQIINNFYFNRFSLVSTQLIIAPYTLLCIIVCAAITFCLSLSFSCVQIMSTHQSICYQQTVIN